MAFCSGTCRYKKANFTKKAHLSGREWLGQSKNELRKSENFENKEKIENPLSSTAESGTLKQCASGQHRGN
jgi:hypothetical protein